MLPRERVLAALHHEEPDRVPYTDNPWFTTVERWRREGLPADVAPEDYFGFEFEGFGADSSLMLPTRVIEETSEYIIETNSNGVTTKNFKHQTSTPGLLGFTLTSRAVWDELKPRLVYRPERLNWSADKPRLEKARSQGKFVHIAFPVGYDELSSTVGPETLLTAMLSEPEWVADMFKTFMDLKIACAEEMLALGYEFDGAFIYDDLGYRNGPFFSPATYRELLFPQHKRLCDFLHSK
ncbi:MAG: hypothetical protein V2A74_11460, partial [bacterium]